MIIDSAMSRKEAFLNLSPDCPREIINAQTLVNVEYYGPDGELHRGQIVIDKRLANDVRAVFTLMNEIKFPIERAVPAADPEFFKNNKWDDEILMDKNITSSFNYRTIAGLKKLSNHARGRAIDINPRLNPYIHKGITEPSGASYDTSRSGTLTSEHPVVLKFKALGWKWGGDWEPLKDYQHFEKD